MTLICPTPPASNESSAVLIQNPSKRVAVCHRKCFLTIGAGMLLLIIGRDIAFAEEKKTAAQEALEQRQKVEIMSFFLKNPKEAVLPKTPLGVQLYNQAVEYFQKSQYELARQAIEGSLVQDNTNPLAYELLGDIHSLEQKLAEAKANYEIAYNLRPRDSLKEKIEKLTQEATVEKKMVTYKEEHFLIKYYDREQHYEGFALREILRTSYQDISRDFGFYFKHQVVVLLYDEADFKKITNTPHWVSGVYDGKIRMPINKQGFDNEQQLKALTVHEVTHAFVAAMSSGRAPAWINEGLAVYEENKVQPVAGLVFDAAVKTHTLFPIDELMNAETVALLTDPIRVNLFYQQSFHLVDYLVDRYKMFLVKQVLAEFAKGRDSDQAIREVLKISPQRLENEWKATFLK